MPIYEYRCQDCGEKFEKLVRGNSGQPELTCPNCGGLLAAASKERAKCVKCEEVVELALLEETEPAGAD